MTGRHFETLRDNYIVGASSKVTLVDAFGFLFQNFERWRALQMVRCHFMNAS